MIYIQYTILLALHCKASCRRNLNMKTLISTRCLRNELILISIPRLCCSSSLQLSSSQPTNWSLVMRRPCQAVIGFLIRSTKDSNTLLIIMFCQLITAISTLDANSCLDYWCDIVFYFIYKKFPYWKVTL